MSTVPQSLGARNKCVPCPPWAQWRMLSWLTLMHREGGFLRWRWTHPKERQEKKNKLQSGEWQTKMSLAVNSLISLRSFWRLSIESVLVVFWYHGYSRDSRWLSAYNTNRIMGQATWQVTYRSFFVHEVSPMPLTDGFPILFVGLLFLFHFTHDVFTVDECLETTNYNRK